MWFFIRYIVPKQKSTQYKMEIHINGIPPMLNRRNCTHSHMVRCSYQDYIHPTFLDEKKLSRIS